MELTVLGTSGTWPPAGGETCGYLLSHDDTHVWMDAGTGTFARLQEHIDLAQLSAILITHGHPDHFVDVVPCFYARHYGGLGPAHLPFYSPPGFVELMGLLVSEDGRDVMSQAYAYTTVRGGDRFQVGPMSFSVFEMTHIGVEAVGFRVEVPGATLAYTGDTGPCPEAVELARDVDVFMAEATYQNANTLLPFHMSAAQAGEHATAAGAKELLLTHLLPGLDPGVSLLEARETFNGPVGLAVTGMKREIGS